jgi:hypothetical protein
MKRYFILMLLTVITSLGAMAQSRQGTVEYNKQQVPCYITEMPYSKSVAEDAIKERFKTMGAKGNDKKGFTEYNNIVLPELGTTPVDAKFKVEKRDNNSSTVYMIVSPAGSNGAGGANVADYSAGSTNFLSALSTSTSDYSLELEIKKQEDEVKKAEKKSGNLIEDGNDMQRKLQRLQNDIEDNRKKQADQIAELQRQRDLLTQVQARRRAKA